MQTSLRKSKISGPGQPQKLTKSNTKSSKDARKSKVGDKIKKRMSMRYADISAPTGGVPPMPAFNLQDLQASIQDETILHDPDDTFDDIKTIDTSVLQEENFDPDAYLKSKLGRSTEAEIKSLQSSLEASKAATATDLQRNVFKNYAEFVLISKEISTLENDMLELKESLSEWKSMPTLLNIEEPSASVSDRRRANRSSVADLRALYVSQLQALHSKVEGSSKFVPVIPGRHIIGDFDNMWTLNPATYKVEYAVHFVLLDDSLLVAKRRKRSNGSEGGRLVAERYWPLNEIVVLDVKDTSEVFHAFKIRRGKESHVYKANKSADKRSFLSAAKEAAEEYATKRRKEREGEHERRRSVWNASERTSVAFGEGEPMPPLPGWRGQSDPSKREGKDREENKGLGEFSDELSVAIALREWDEAVGLVEKGEILIPSTPQLSPILTPLTASLTSALLHALSDLDIRKSTVVHLTSLLLRLRAGPAARDTFLSTRADLIRKRTRTIRFEGDISLYISELALVIFTAIKNTADWYLLSFKEHDMTSALIQWAKEQIEIFAKMFRRQVYGGEVDPNVVRESLHNTRSQSRKLLRDSGLDFTFVLQDLIAPPPNMNLSEASSRSSSPSIAASSPLTSNPPTPLTPTPTTSILKPSRPPRSPAPPPRSRDRPSGVGSKHDL